MNDPYYRKPVRRFFRDLDSNMLAGVCSGLAIYFNTDVVLVRILFIILLMAGTTGFWAYIIICIVAPAARTAEEKCLLRGLPLTEENLRMFSKKR